MKICRANIQVDRRDAQLNECDVYLLSLLEQPLTLTELVEISPHGEQDTITRLGRLALRGLVELTYEHQDERLLIPRALYAGSGESVESFPTLRPPPPRRLDFARLRSPLPRAPESNAPSTGIRERPTRPDHEEQLAPAGHAPRRDG